MEKRDESYKQYRKESKKVLKQYQKGEISWDEYQKRIDCLAVMLGVKWIDGG